MSKSLAQYIKILDAMQMEAFCIGILVGSPGVTTETIERAIDGLAYQRIPVEELTDAVLGSLNPENPKIL